MKLKKAYLKMGLVGVGKQVYGPYLVFVNKVSLEYSPFVYMLLMAAFMLQWQNHMAHKA